MNDWWAERFAAAPAGSSTIKNRRTRRRVWYLAIALGVPLLLFGLSQLDPFGEDYVAEFVPDAKQLAACEQLLGMTFPKSTRPIRLHYLGGWLDDSMHLKIEIAADDVPALIAASPFAGTELSETENSMWAVQDLNWWDPETVKTFEYGKTQLPDLSHLRILIDTGKKDVAVVYLNWFQT